MPQSPRTPSEVVSSGSLTINSDLPVPVATYAHMGSPQLSDDEQMPSQPLEEPPPAVQNIEIDLKCGEKVTDSDSEGLDTRDYLPSHHDHTRRPKPIKARAGSSDNLLGGITASSPGGPKGFQPTGGAFKSTHADTGESHRQWTAFTQINKPLLNQVPSSPHPTSVASSTQSLTHSVQGISLSTPNLSTQAALDNAIASIMNSPTSTCGVQVISSGMSNTIPTPTSTPLTSTLSNPVLKSFTLVKRSIGDNSPLSVVPGPLTLSLDASGNLLLKPSQATDSPASDSMHCVHLQRLYVPTFSTEVETPKNNSQGVQNVQNVQNVQSGQSVIVSQTNTTTALKTTT